ncbi:TRADD-N-associated membrane domain-containing protein [Panacibacter ginsenosidivorans]|nr:hypothetical protein [Panacibacter ginsenosidivorans]
MKALGIILTIAGIFMFISSNINQKVVDSYTGAIAAICGMVVLVASRKKA